MRRLVERDLAGDANRPAGLPGREEVHRLAILDEPVRSGGGRGRFAAVEDGDLVACTVVVDHESAPADAGALRLDQAKNGMYGNCRVHSVAALAKHADTRLNGARVCSGDHRAFGPRHIAKRSGIIACGRGDTGYRRRLGRRGASSQQQGGS